jgi:hypothetical protein
MPIVLVVGSAESSFYIRVMGGRGGSRTPRAELLECGDSVLAMKTLSVSAA